VTKLSIEPFPNPAPSVPPPAEPVPPIVEPEPDRLPDEALDPNPDENDEPTKFSVDDIVRIYGLSRQDAIRKIRRFGPVKAELDLMLGSRHRTQGHRREEIGRNADQIAFG